MSEQWIELVDAYLGELDDAVDRLEQALDAFNSSTAQGEFNRLGAPTEAAAEAVRLLEALLDRRSTLLQSAPGATRPRSLRSALRHMNQNDRVDRAERLAGRIKTQRQNAIAQFVTQFQLADTQARLIRILTQSGPDAGTYGPKKPARGGNLLDGAA